MSSISIAAYHVTLRAPKNTPDKTVDEMIEALDDLDLLTEIEKLVTAHVTSRTVFSGLTVTVED